MKATQQQYFSSQYPSKYTKKGFVYILSNKSMPGIYKIGCTSRSPVERASQLCTTGVPTPFQVEYYINIENYTYIEKQVHKVLHQYNFGKEFFKYDLYKCILEIRKIASNYSYTENFSSQYIKAQVDGKGEEYIQEERRKKELEDEKKRKQEEKRKEDEKRTTNYLALALFIFGIYLLNSNFGETIPMIIIGLSIYIAVKNN